jgi:MFS transporter, PAT family, beta-lactamase induction signal transducer AmpG
MIASGAGALLAAAHGGWEFAYGLMACLMLVGMVTVWLTPEPSVGGALEPVPGATPLERARAWIARAVVAPFADILRRGGVAGSVLILLFVVLYKLGDAIAGTMSNPLYVGLGYSKEEIAWVVKLFGVVATLAGVAIGGVMVLRIGLFRALLIAGVLQMLSNVAYILLVWAGHDVGMLAVAIAVENLTSGMGSAAFVAYLSGLCNVAFTATQYALLSSLATTGVNVLSASGGYLADELGWVRFFVLSMVLALPGLGLLVWIMRRGPAEMRPQSAPESAV